ncbi:MAG: MaoC/PaaZ C-terminal domain-containing protein [Paraburkholderia sp.]|jgi:acyl dehydratase|uniref:MaoC family dehydratase n=1 Tax=Paraburkholderia sp. TaxID=1926495 RepID=UPI00397D9F46
MPGFTTPHRGPVSTLIGTETSYSRTVSEYDVYGFAGISGDNHPNHIDEEYCNRVGLRARVAQGAMLVGYMAGAVTKYLGLIERPAVSYGYDRVRFTKSVFIGDTLTIHYQIVRADDEKKRAWANATLTNQHGEVVSVGTHIIHFQE